MKRIVSPSISTTSAATAGSSASRVRRRPARAGARERCRAPRRARAPPASARGGRRSSRAGARRGFREPRAAPPGRGPRRRRVRARARRTGSRRTVRGCGAASGARTACRSRSRRRRWIPPTLSGPTASRSVLSAPTACSRAVGSVFERSAARAAGARGPSRVSAGRTRGRTPTTRRAIERRLSRGEAALARRAAGWRCESRCRAPAGATASSDRVFDEERDLERAPPRGREGGQHLVQHVLEQIAEPDVSEALLGLGGPRLEDTEPERPACSTPSSQIVDFPIPAPPSSTSAAGPGAVRPRNSRTAASSGSRLTISSTIVVKRLGAALTSRGSCPASRGAART